MTVVTGGRGKWERRTAIYKPGQENLLPYEGFSIFRPTPRPTEADRKTTTRTVKNLHGMHDQCLARSLVGAGASST